MSKAFVHLGISLDGFVAGVDRGPKNPLGHMGMKVHEWLFHTRAFRENLKIGHRGETGAADGELQLADDAVTGRVMGCGLVALLADVHADGDAGHRGASSYTGLAQAGDR